MVEWMEITFRNEKFSELKYEMLTIRKSSLAKFFQVLIRAIILWEKFSNLFKNINYF